MEYLKSRYEAVRVLPRGLVKCDLLWIEYGYVSVKGRMLSLIWSSEALETRALWYDVACILCAYVVEASSVDIL